MGRLNAAKAWGTDVRDIVGKYNFLIDLLDRETRHKGTINNKEIEVIISPKIGFQIKVDGVTTVSIDPETGGIDITSYDAEFTKLIYKELLGANSIIKADTISEPESMLVPEGRLIGRLTGGSIAALTPADIRTLLNVMEGAEPNAVTSVNTYTGAVTITKTDIGLSSVDDVQQAPISHVGDTGTAHGEATITVNGFMTASDKIKLNNIESNAQVNNIHKYTEAIGDEVETSFTVTHSLNDVNVIVQVYQTATPYEQVDTYTLKRTGANAVEIEFAAAPGTDEYTVIVMG